jgi:hypothetical protein
VLISNERLIRAVRQLPVRDMQKTKNRFDVSIRRRLLSCFLTVQMHDCDLAALAVVRSRLQGSPGDGSKALASSLLRVPEANLQAGINTNTSVATVFFEARDQFLIDIS